MRLPKSAAQVEVKSPTGPQLDMVTIMPMLNPRLMPVPVMIIHGQYDDVADLDGLLPFFAQLPNPRKQYVSRARCRPYDAFAKGTSAFSARRDCLLQCTVISSRFSVLSSRLFPFLSFLLLLTADRELRTEN